jgi:hypothetical protein
LEEDNNADKKSVEDQNEVSNEIDLPLNNEDIENKPVEE